MKKVFLIIGMLLSVISLSAPVKASLPAPTTIKSWTANLLDDYYSSDDAFYVKLDPFGAGSGMNIVVRRTADGEVFDFASENPVYAVLVKGGPGALLYDYRPDGVLVSSDKGLHAPIDANSAKHYDISHAAVIAGTPTPVPESATMLLFGAGLLGLAGLGKRIRKSN